ncbi:MAG: DegT/DnrJ/EryC1/StrS family aminotransferase, partial [Endomicrobiia bacterium]|nr:DegT/DnrJ/EryC1/StrS family aminotransferase [Endomicrobiia bacterium]
MFAAVGSVQLSRLENEFKPARQKLARNYHEALKAIDDIVLFPDDYSQIIPHIFPIKVRGGKRDELRRYLLENNIECGIHYLPNHLLSLYGAKKGLLPTTERLYSELLSIPLHPAVTPAEQEY